jgi:EpsI family protein
VTTLAGKSVPYSSRRELLLGGTLACAAAAAGAMRLSSDAGAPTGRAPLEQLIPGRIGQWVREPFADVLIPQGEVQEDKAYDDLFTGYYAAPGGGGIMLLVAYGSAQVGDTELHRPEVCYPAAGFQLERWPDVVLSLPGQRVRAVVMTARAPDRTEQMLYWSRIGGDFPTSSLAQRWAILRQSLRGAVPDGVLVRMSTIGADRAAGVQTLESFAGEMVAAGGPVLHQMLLGRA